jgi:hypothetical protein
MREHVQSRANIGGASPLPFQEPVPLKPQPFPAGRRAAAAPQAAQLRTMAANSNHWMSGFVSSTTGCTQLWLLIINHS